MLPLIPVFSPVISIKLQENWMSEDVMEEELLRSIDEVDAKLQNFRKKVQAALTDMQGQVISKEDTSRANSEA